MSSIGISITAACGQCHISFPVNALSTEAHCPDCNQRLPIDWSVWRDVLAAAAVDGPNAAPNQHHLEALSGGSNTTLVRNYVRKDATCAKCKAVIPLPRALQGADHGFCICVQCGDKISLRAAPNEIKQLGGITHIIGEELAPSGRSRLFYLWHDRPEHGAKAGGQFHWKYLKDVVGDRNGNLYFIDEHDGRIGLFSLDAQLKPRWARKSILASGDAIDQPIMCLTPNGYLIVRGRDRHHAMVISCADGSTAMNLGGREDPNAQAHGFDLKDCTTLTCDVDGTIIGAIHKRLLRWTYDGQPLETWPGVTGFFGGHQKLQPLYRAGEREERVKIEASNKYPPDPKEIGNHPYEIDGDYAELHVGYDGLLVYRESRDFAKFDRQGKVVMRASIPSELSYETGIQTDMHGNTYLRCEHERAGKIVRISPDGKQVGVFVDGSRPGTPIWDGDHLVVSADGTMFLFDDNGSARCFNADGSLRFVSPKAREADQEEVRRREAESR